MKSIYLLSVIMVLFFSCTRKMGILDQHYKFEPAESVFLAKQFPEHRPNYEAMEQAHEIAQRKITAGQRTSGN